jgi:hypothetical protein
MVLGQKPESDRLLEHNNPVQTSGGLWPPVSPASVHRQSHRFGALWRCPSRWRVLVISAGWTRWLW